MTLGTDLGAGPIVWSRRHLLWLLSMTAFVGPAKAENVIVEIRQFKFEPAEIQLAAGATVAQSLAKRAIDEGLEGPLADGLTLEQELFAEVFDTDDAKIGVQSFLEQGPGKARFTGR